MKIPERNDIEKYISSIGNTPDMKTPELKKEINNYLERYESLKKKAIELLNSSKKILLYGDYDVDGCGAVTIMYKFLTALGKDVEVVIPNRSDGYGINQKLFDKTKYDTLIFCDCGIADVKNLKDIKNDNNNIIVIDHHTENPEVNNYIDILFKPEDINISSGGLSYLFTELLNQYYKKPYELLSPYACLTQISDMMELKGVGYTIARLGFLQLQENKNTNKILNKLLFNKNFSSEDLAFSVIPVLNAASRMTENSKLLFEVLNNPSIDRISILQEANKERKNIQSNTVKEIQNILSLIDESVSSDLDKAVVVPYKDNYIVAVKNKNSEKNLVSAVKEHIKNNKMLIVIQTGKTVILVDNTGEVQHGLLGPIANELLSKFDTPVFVISKTNGHYSGSSRSASASVYDILKQTEDILGKKWGGHKAAAGFAIDENKLIPFLELLTSATETLEVQTDQTVKATFNYIDLSQDDIKLLNNLEPFDHTTRPTFGFCGIVTNKQTINDKLTKITLLLKGNGPKELMLYNQPDIKVNKFYAFLTSKIDINNSTIFVRDFSEHFKIENSDEMNNQPEQKRIKIN